MCGRPPCSHSGFSSRRVAIALDAFSRPDVNGYGGVETTSSKTTWIATARWGSGVGHISSRTSLRDRPRYGPATSCIRRWCSSLFVPFTFLPPILWWAVPIGVVAWVVWRLAPGPLAWPVMALCLVWPPTQVKLITGNPVVWSVAALALACLNYWPSVLVLIKPSLFPFALFGATHRSWWVALRSLRIGERPVRGDVAGLDHVDRELAWGRPRLLDPGDPDATSSARRVVVAIAAASGNQGRIRPTRRPCLGRPASSMETWYMRRRGLTKTDAATASAQPARVGAKRTATPRRTTTDAAHSNGDNA